MNSNEVSWLDLIKEHKWKIIVAAICIFAGIYYFSIGNQPVDTTSTPTGSATSTQRPSPAPSATATATGTATVLPTATSSPTPPPPVFSGENKSQAPAPADWKPTASAFASAWANPKVGQEAWLNAIKPTVTPDLYDKFSTTDVEQMSQLEILDIIPTQEDYMGVNARVSFKNTNFSMVIHLAPQPDMTWLVSVVTSS